MYEVKLKSSLADQDILMKCDQMEFLFLHSPPCGRYIFSISVVVLRSYLLKKSTADITSSYEIFSLSLYAKLFCIFHTI